MENKNGISLHPFAVHVFLIASLILKGMLLSAYYMQLVSDFVFLPCNCPIATWRICVYI